MLKEKIQLLIIAILTVLFIIISATFALENEVKFKGENGVEQTHNGTHWSDK